MTVKTGECFVASEGRKLRVLNVSDDSRGTWVTYTFSKEYEKIPHTYSCLVDAFLDRFSKIDQ